MSRDLMKTAGAWFQAIRPFSFTGSVVPVALGSVFAMREAAFKAGYFILSLVAIVSLQASINLFSDYDDYKNSVDTADSYGSSGVILKEILTPQSVLFGGRFFLTLGFLIGVFLSIERGVFIFIIGILGALSGYSYTGKPLTLKYRGLGAPLVFLLFGPLMVVGAYYVQAQKISAAAFLISVPVGLLTTAILHANDIRDIHHDKRSGIKTLSIITGENNSHRIYYALIYVSYISILIMVYFRLLPFWSLLCFITLPGALKGLNRLRVSGSTAAGLATFDKETAELHAKFGVVLILSIILYHLIG